MKIKVGPISYARVVMNTDMIPDYAGRKMAIENMKKTTRIARPLMKNKDIRKATKSLGSARKVEDIFCEFIELMEETRGPDSGYSTELGTDGKIKFRMHYYFPTFNYQFYAMPLEFLPGLAERNKNMHDIMVNSIRYLGTKKRWWLLDDLGFFEIDEWINEVLNCKTEHEDEDYDYWQEAMDRCEMWNVHYYKLINRKYTNKKPLLEKINNFHCTCDIERQVLKWCKEIIEIADLPGTMEGLIQASMKQFLEENEKTEDDLADTGWPLIVSQWLNFIWLDNEEYMEHLGQWLGDTAGNFGVAELASSTICETQKDLEKSRKEFEKICGSWPGRMYEAMRIGLELVPRINDYSKGILTEILNDGTYSKQETIPA